MLFEGSPRAVEAQIADAQSMVGGVGGGAEAWDVSRRRQAEARGRVRFDPGRLGETLAALGDAVVRPSAGVAYTAADQPSDTVSQGGIHQLVERIRREFDPNGVLSA